VSEQSIAKSFVDHSHVPSRINFSFREQPAAQLAESESFEIILADEFHQSLLAFEIWLFGNGDGVHLDLRIIVLKERFHHRHRPSKIA
jgi:hypothetical protein